MRVRGPEGEHVVVTLLHEGATCSLIVRDFARDLGVRGPKEPLCNMVEEQADSESLLVTVASLGAKSESCSVTRLHTVQELSYSF